MRARLAFVTVATVCFIASASGAPAQRVTVDMKNVTINDVLKELQKQTGLRLYITGRAKPFQAPVGARIAELKADNAPLKHVLREACAETGYTYRRLNDKTFRVEAGEIPAPSHWAHVGDYEITVSRLSTWGRQSSLDLSNSAPRTSDKAPQLWVELSLEADTIEDARRLVDLREITIVDSDGKETTALAKKGRRLAFSRTNDIVKTSISFAPPSLEATEIATLMGVVEIREPDRRASLKLDAPTTRPVSRSHGDVDVVLNRIDRPTTGSRQPLWRAQLETRNLEHGPIKEGRWRTRQLNLTYGRNRGYPVREVKTTVRDGVTTWDLSFILPRNVEPTGLRVDMIYRPAQVAEHEFMIRNIPLPQ